MPSLRSPDLYNALFPSSVEVCAVTQYQRKGAKPGGWGGHATLFLTGAEIDTGAAYPRLRLRAAGTDPPGPDSGIGISVNKIFENVAWVAIPGRDEFFRGGLGPGQTLDEGFYRAAIQRAAAAGWFAGIRIKADLMRQRPAAVSREEFIVQHSIGTDFALNFARTAYRARLPIRREALGKVIDYLNGVNESAQRSGYSWNIYTNNCSHVAHNALAAAGVWDPKVARQAGTINLAKEALSVAKALALSRMSDFSFPANNFVRLYEAGNERPIDDALAAFRNHDVRRTMDDSWMSTGAGALIATSPMHDAGLNRMFAPGRDPFLFSVPVLWEKDEKFRTLTREPPPTVTDLRANLRHFRDRLATTLASRGNVDNERHFLHGDEDEQDFRGFYRLFYDQISVELKNTEARLSDYERLTSPT